MSRKISDSSDETTQICGPVEVGADNYFLPGDPEITVSYLLRFLDTPDIAHRNRQVFREVLSDNLIYTLEPMDDSQLCAALAAQIHEGRLFLMPEGERSGMGGGGGASDGNKGGQDGPGDSSNSDPNSPGRGSEPQNELPDLPSQDTPAAKEDTGKHCDVDTLKMVVMGYNFMDPPDSETEKPHNFTLQTDKIRRTEKVTIAARAERPLRTRKIQTLLHNYDLIIDTIGLQPIVPTDWTTEGTYHGLECETGKHSALLYKRLTSHGTEPPADIIEVGAAKLSSGPDKLFPLRLEMQKTASQLVPSAVRGPFRFIEGLLSTEEPTLYRVIAQGCGKRSDEKPPIRELKGLVRVFRKSHWLFEITLPAWHTRAGSQSRASLQAGTTQAESSSSSSNRGDSASSTTTTTTNADGSVRTSTATDTTSGDNTARSTSTDITGGGRVDAHIDVNQSNTGTGSYSGHRINARGEEIPLASGQRREFGSDQALGELDDPDGISVVLKYNDEALELPAVIGSVKNQIEDLKNIVTNIEKALKSAPQIGWKLGFEFSAMVGKFSVDISPDYMDGPLANGRYYGVTPLVCKVGVEMEIFRLAVDGSFGVSCDVAGSSATVTGKLTIEAKAAVNGTVTLEYYGKKEWESKISTEGNVVGEANIKAQVMGWTLVDGNVSVGTGIIAEGKYTIDLNTKKSKLEGEVAFKDVTLNGRLKAPGFAKRTINPPIQLLEGKKIYEYK